MPEPSADAPGADADGFVRLRGLDLLVGWIGGLTAADAPLPTTTDPRKALETVLLPALKRSPCLVTFSGGRDSSLVLGCATDLARREGLPDPVPITRVYPDHPDADEEDCQQAVVDHLGLLDWIRIPVNDQQDLLGPWSGPRLARYGLLFPVGAHSGSVLYGAAAGATMLTGEGGDEVLEGSRSSLLRLALNRRRPLRRTVPAAASSLAPSPVRRRLAQRDLLAAYPWLPPAVARTATAHTAREIGAEPFTWSAAKLRLLRRRGVAGGLRNLIRLAAEHDIRLENPLLDPRFVGAVAAYGARWGVPSRNVLLQRLFADVLPPEVLERRTKVSFNAAVMGEHSRRFAQAWDGSGVDPRVDADVLRAAWLSDTPPASSLSLLQAAWLHSQGIADTGTGPVSRAA